MASSASRASRSQGPSLKADRVPQNGQSQFSVQRHPSDSSNASSEHSIMRGKRREDFLQVNRPKAYSSSSRNTQETGSTRVENRLAQREVRTLPSWIDSYEEDDDDSRSKPTASLLKPPSRAHSAQHHYTPANPERRVSRDGYVEPYESASHGAIGKKPETGFFGGHREPVAGRKWDHARDAEPVIMQSGVLPTSSPWRNFIKSSMYGPAMGEDPVQVDDDFLRQLTPGYEKPWRGDLEENGDQDNVFGLLHNKKQRKTFISRWQNILVMHPFVPLVFRVIVFLTSIISLGLSGSVDHLSNKYGYRQNSSTIMAIVVDSVAIPYILYITWDEYTGKPLGLRSPRAKIRLVLLDLFFIIFEAANLSLAFAALTDADGACQQGVVGESDFNGVVCHRVRALCAILMIALVAWSLTFAVSIFRLVERVGGREESD